jgi:hypothetical protein
LHLKYGGNVSQQGGDGCDDVSGCRSNHPMQKGSDVGNLYNHHAYRTPNHPQLQKSQVALESESVAVIRKGRYGCSLQSSQETFGEGSSSQKVRQLNCCKTASTK